MFLATPFATRFAFRVNLHLDRKDNACQILQVEDGQVQMVVELKSVDVQKKKQSTTHCLRPKLLQDFGFETSTIIQFKLKCKKCCLRDLLSSVLYHYSRILLWLQECKVMKSNG